MFGHYLQLVSSGHYAKIPHYEITRKKRMDFLIIWVLSGRGFAETEGLRIEAAPGHLLTFMPGNPHRYGTDPQNLWDILWLHLQGRLAEGFIDQIRRYSGACVELGFDAELYDRWEGVVAAQAVGGPGSEMYGNTSLCGLLGLILSRLERNALSSSETGSCSLDVQRMQNYIHHHLAAPLTTEALASQAHLSSSHFSRLFKNCLGVSPMCYVVQKRIGLACSLLTETRMTLGEIGLRVGYGDPYYFSRLFAKQTGICPSRYRARQKGSGTQ